MKCLWSAVYTEGNPRLLSQWQSLPYITRLWVLQLHVQGKIVHTEIRFSSGKYCGYFQTYLIQPISLLSAPKNNFHLLNNTLL